MHKRTSVFVLILVAVPSLADADHAALEISDSHAGDASPMSDSVDAADFPLVGYFDAHHTFDPFNPPGDPQISCKPVYGTAIAEVLW